jgi:hypothetical protein
MSMPKPEMERLLQAAKARSRQLRNRRRTLTGGLTLAVAAAVAIAVLSLGGRPASQGVVVSPGPSTTSPAIPPTTVVSRQSTTTVRPSTREAPGTSTTSTTTALPPSTREVPVTSTTSSTTIPRTTLPVPPGKAVRLVVTPALEETLTATYAQYEQIPPADIAGTIQGSVYYAYAPATGTYWAVARVMPSPSAPSAVADRFQDGNNYGIFVQQAGSPWTILNIIGEPPCPTHDGLPTSVEALWQLPQICEGASPGSEDDTAAPYHVSFDVPADWSATPYAGATFDESGNTGFVTVNAATSGGTVLATCRGVATDNVNHPYGTRPSVEPTTIDGQPGCFIIPSEDSPTQAVRAGGPVFRYSSLVVEYRQPVTISGQQFSYLLITCDPSHLWAIATTVDLDPGL